MARQCGVDRRVVRCVGGAGREGLAASQGTSFALRAGMGRLSRVLVVLSTLAMSGVFVGSGVTQLVAAHYLPIRSPPWISERSIDRESAPEVRMSMFERGHDASVPAVEGTASCPAWTLVGTFVMRGAPEESFAAVRTASGSRLIGPSMTVDGSTLVSIAPDHLVLQTASDTCEVEMYGAPVDVAPPTRAAPSDDLFVEVAPRHYRIDRSVIQAPDLRRIRAIPDERGGVVLFGIRPGSSAARAGLANGDRVVTIDGRPLDSTEAGLDAYARALAGEHVQATVVRRSGETVELTYELGP